MDSFVLSETLKYLYLLFTKKEDLIIDLNQFIFTTEAHFLPLSLRSIPEKSKLSNDTSANLNSSYNENLNDDQNKQLTCPNLNNLFKKQAENENFLFFKNRSSNKMISKPSSINFYKQVRNNLKNYVDLSHYDKMKYNSFNLQTFRDFNFNDNNNNDINLPNFNNPQQQDQFNELDLDLTKAIRLEPQDFSATNSQHLEILRTMGINIIQMNPNDPIQLVHLMSTAENIEAGKEGIIFIKKMIKLSKKQTLTFSNFVSFVKFNLPFNENMEIQLPACSSQFGIQLNENEKLKFSAEVSIVTPLHGCNETIDSRLNNVKNKFALVERGECMFIQKVRNVEKMGALGVIIIDNVKDSSSLTLPQFEMLGDGKNDVKIPVVLLYRKEADMLLDSLKLNQNLIVHLTNIVDETEEKPMFKLINTLKEARIQIDLKLKDKKDQKSNNSKMPNEFKEVLNDVFLLREKFANILDDKQLPDITKKLMNEFKKFKDLTFIVENLGDLSSNELFDQLKLKINDFKLIEKNYKLLKNNLDLLKTNKLIKRKNICKKMNASNFRNFIKNYWICK